MKIEEISNNLDYKIGEVRTIAPRLHQIAKFPILGWETKERWYCSEYVAQATYQYNKVKILGYVPLLNIIISIGLIALSVFGVFKLGLTTKHKRIFVRAALMTAFGPALLIADIVKQKLQNQIILKNTNLKAPISWVLLKKD